MTDPQHCENSRRFPQKILSGAVAFIIQEAQEGGRKPAENNLDSEF